MNIENFKRVLDIIEEHPDKWDQTVWHCRTAHCLAGHCELLLAEVQPQVTEDIEKQVCLMEKGLSTDEEYRKKDELVILTKERARGFLEVSHYEADFLFDQDRTLEDFQQVLDEGIDVAMEEIEGS